MFITLMEIFQKLLLQQKQVLIKFVLITVKLLKRDLNQQNYSYDHRIGINNGFYQFLIYMLKIHIHQIKFINFFQKQLMI